MGRSWIAFPGVFIALAGLDCGSGGTGVGPTGTGGAPCGPYGSPTTSTVMGEGFGAWEGEPVSGEFVPAQSFSSGHDTDTVVAGRFSLTASVCTGIDWRISVGASGHQISCPEGSPVTPAACRCQPGSEFVQAGTSGHDCAAFDGGAGGAPGGN